MKKSVTSFKKGSMFFIIILVIINIGYISAEIYKSKISKSLVSSPHITQSEFSGVETLSDYGRVFEITFILLSIIWIFWGFLKKNVKSIEPLLLQLFLLIVLFTFNYSLSWIFTASVGNLTLLLLLPAIYVSGALIFYVLKSMFQKKGNYSI